MKLIFKYMGHILYSLYFKKYVKKILPICEIQKSEN